ncbi:hypothetical protein HDV03_000875 [Kappamyces sp. JEL0829]|nr:hypothetical protein HDV03_000875 [Kappamyces sp. JEL0829]
MTKTSSVERVREYYGFVLYLSSFLALFLYLAWAFLDEAILEDLLGWTWIPFQPWSILVPLYIMAWIPFTIVFYTATNLQNTLAFDDPHLLTDPKVVAASLTIGALVFLTQAHLMSWSASNLDRILDWDQIPELEDVPISVVNKCWSRSRPKQA